jgi:hypothetical protein
LETNGLFMKKLTLLVSVTSFAVAVSAPGQIIVNETFESYADTAAMEAVWGPTTGLGELVTTNGNTGNSAWHPGGAVNQVTTFSVLPSATMNLVLTADIYDSNVGLAQRNTVGLRNGANPLFEMGHYNTASTQYAVRLLSMYGQGGAWTFFPGVSRTAGWNRFQATMTATDITITLDIGADGTIDSTLNFVGALPANPFVDLRFGGPSAVTSVAPAWFDNIKLELVTIPEPSTWLLGLLGGLGTLWAVRRRAA